MSVGGTRSPYRPPCGYAGDDAEKIWLGAAFQHYRATENGIARFTNTTTGAGDTTDTLPDDTSPNAAPLLNTYAASDPATVLNLATCRKVGFKFLVAMKFWQGIFGFVDRFNDATCTPDGDCCDHPIVSSYPTTKYRTITWACTGTQGDGTGTNVLTFSATGSCTVDRNSGLLSGTISQSGSITNNEFPDQMLNPDDPTAIDHLIIGLVLSEKQNGLWKNSSDDTGYPGPGYIAPLLNGTGDGSVDILDATVSNTVLHIKGQRDAAYLAMGYGQFDFEVTVTLSDEYTSDEVNADADALLAFWDLSNDAQYPWRVDTNCTSGPLVTYYERSDRGPTVQIQGQTPPGDVVSGTDYVINGFTWNWTFSSGTPGTSVTTVSGNITDGANEDGSVVGKPTPVGYDAYWDFRHPIYNTVDGCITPTLWGQASPFPNATQWLDAVDAACIPPGAFAAYNSLQFPSGSGWCVSGTYKPGLLIKSKYAEVTLLGAPSHDFARPCGPKDAATIDQNSVSCSDGTGTLRWMGYPNPCPVPPADGGEWNDNSPKGDWCLLTWTFHYRDVGEYARIEAGGTGVPGSLSLCSTDPGTNRPLTGPWSAIDCSPQCSVFVPCCPAAVYLVPDSDPAQPEAAGASVNSQIFTYAALSCDEVYGSRWQQMIQQWMVDPLWQPPKPPCDLADGLAWTEDDGSGQCADDTHQYYPQRPWEEARCAVPDGAPALPAGCYIGVLDVASINAGDTTGNIIAPPAAGACWNTWWIWAINRANTILTGGGGCWACEYEDPLAVCDDDPEFELP